MQRKTVTELNRIKADVFESREKLQICSDDLESLCFEMSSVKCLDDIRVAKNGFYTDILKSTEKARLAFGRALKVHTAAVNKYREFFVC